MLDAFLNSRRLKFVNLPESVKSVGHLAFANTNITTPIYNSLIFAYLPPNYSKYSIPDGIEIVADGAFACCYNLDSVVFPMSVKIIGEQAFAANNGFKPEIPGCPYLKEINSQQWQLQPKIFRK